MKNPHRIVIVGGVAGGASAAAKARRIDEMADIQIFERGPYISFANCGLPYFIAGEIDDRAKLIVMRPERFWERSRVRAHVNHEVLSINRAAKTICVKQQDGGQRDVPYDKLILSQGVKPIVPSIPGANLPHVFTLRDIPDMDRIAAFVNERQPRHAVVIGGGFIGLEMAEAGKNLNASARALLEEDLRSPCTEEIAVFRAFARTVAEGKDAIVPWVTEEPVGSERLQQLFQTATRQIT
jgi:NADPH-dependent 2,4-dienoyl-CoA reductase/sulfur reductase-like enzyme